MASVKLIGITQPIDLELTTGEFIAYVARVSNPSNQLNTETSPKLLNYLKKNKHWSPFEMASIVMEIKTTRDIAHQILRHRSFSFQEFSQRYAVSSVIILKEARFQDPKNRQSSIELTVEHELLAKQWLEAQQEVVELTQRVYKWALDAGIAKEVARSVLPEGLTGTTIYMAGTIRSWMHFCEVRTDPSTQKEHREIALACKEILDNELQKPRST
jgi:thymidylate synthase (FAD)